MKKIFKGLGIGFIALALVVGVGANNTSATTTYAVNAITETGALTVTGGAALTLVGTTASTWSTVAGDLTVESGTTTAGSLHLISDENTTDAINIDATAGGIDIDITGTATEDFNVTNTGGSIVLIATEAIADAINIDATGTAGGVDIDTTDGAIALTAAGAVEGDMTLTVGDDYVANVTGIWDNNVTGAATLDAASISLDATAASNLTVTGAGADLTLASVLGSVAISSTEDAASAISLTANSAGTNDTIVITNTPGTAAGAITLAATAGGITLTAGGAINLTATSDVVVPANIGVTFGTGEKIEGDSTDLTVTSGGLITLTATGNTVVTNAAVINGAFTASEAIIFSGIETIAAGGTTTALDLTESLHSIDADVGGDIFTLADGTIGQVMTITMVSATGIATVTPANLAGGTSVTMNAEGETVMLQFVDTQWYIIGGNAYTVI
ncbi:TPA: hypothetical protein DEQ22_02090 [Candidatus Nomurabacteria bacterium]|uniref:Uncharacterized protein n=1 Tax=Candidatus Nomurabacteria bacterium RIFOXYA2_FULL_42_12 TaxID=1801801 RepID=A0A1F6YPJ0_9BACT|nr:MAG: hypothetical protein UV23_C0018G0011 [Candidatus Nomurabacteria bacterium GW2011_GWF1_42_40]KKT00464.1 MAG: hypothetical protein UV77_C0003G0010 [Candidatus Nomurabacteria bacterium GW2011_GWA1_43_17]OGJ08286.1 MAG: hypothetical protein A2225_00935 [Candidatus Nomurabacteria bacterium RIFOXYA2_FULL_42_12]OGJ09603.1 MAG: hypothetical protein A2443_00675 [Candidatus Nomurabacteria bacterium RIFOXYC2_FULL_43_16]OGJ15124.1 MAG: hypothetical protein A2587_00750 [Candidatus Nomurabacteria bac